MWLDRAKSRIRHIAEVLALDWLPLLVNKSKFPSSRLPGDQRLGEITPRVAALDADELSEIVESLEIVMKEEAERGATIESKAYTLMGVTGVASAFVLGFAQFLRGDFAIPVVARVILSLLYIGIGASFLLTILISKRAVDVGRYFYRKYSPDVYLELATLDKEEFNRQRISHSIFLIEHNRAVNNDKATCVIGAQNWFRNAIVLLFFLLVLLSFTPYVETTPTTLTVTPELTLTPLTTPAGIASPTAPSP